MIQQGKIYKLKEGLSIDPKDYFSKFVYVLDIVEDTLTKKKICIFKHIFIQDKSFVNNAALPSSLPIDQFEANFDIYNLNDNNYRGYYNG